ncbi:MAG: hypothetical protein ACJAZC_000384 [Cryomorphaceae bacterium]|jgi:hypothetical protein
MSGYIEPDPMTPSIPALADAEANSHPLHHTIPAWIMGYWIFSNCRIFMGITAKNAKIQREESSEKPS